MTPQHPPASLYRTAEGLGLWEHRGKVAAVGVGHSPTARRWDGTPETCVGAWSILALRRAIADAGVSPDQIDGLVLDPVTTTGAYWPEGAPVPMDVVNAFQPTSDPLDGIAKLSAEWILEAIRKLFSDVVPISSSILAVMKCMTTAWSKSVQHKMNMTDLHHSRA